MISANGERQDISLPQSAALSILSAGLGAFAASVAFVLFSPFLVRGGGLLAMAPFAILFIFAVSLLFAVPVSLLGGVDKMVTRHGAETGW